MDTIHFAPRGNHGKPFFSGIYRGIIFGGAAFRPSTVWGDDFNRRLASPTQVRQKQHCGHRLLQPKHGRKQRSSNIHTCKVKWASLRAEPLCIATEHAREAKEPRKSGDLQIAEVTAIEPIQPQHVILPYHHYLQNFKANSTQRQRPTIETETAT